MNIPSFRLVNCPDCGKRRLLKELLENGDVAIVSTSTFEVRNEIRFHDACEYCLRKYQNRDAAEIKKNLLALKSARKNSSEATLDL